MPHSAVTLPPVSQPANEPAATASDPVVCARILDYLDGALTPGARAELLDVLVRDASLAREVEELQHVRELLDGRGGDAA